MKNCVFCVGEMVFTIFISTKGIYYSLYPTCFTKKGCTFSCLCDKLCVPGRHSNDQTNIRTKLHTVGASEFFFPRGTD